MALKTKEIRGMNADDRAKSLRDTRQELMHERGLAAMGGAVKNPGRIRDLRTSIARILTIEHQLGEDGREAPSEAGARHAPKAKAPAKGPAKAAPKAAAKPAAKAKPAAAAPKAAKKEPGKTTAKSGGPKR
jgi:large subunit ribosomal protein L29